jgi:hypothetical protein
MLRRSSVRDQGYRQPAIANPEAESGGPIESGYDYNYIM